MRRSDQKKSWKQGLKETAWMATPGLVGAFLFIWGLKVFEWAGHVCAKGGVFVGAGSCLLLLSLYIYWRTDFRGRPEGGSFFRLFISMIGTAALVLIITRLVT